MTSLKRDLWSSSSEESDLVAVRAPHSSLYWSRTVTPDETNDQSSFSDLGWSSIWQEINGPSSDSFGISTDNGLGTQEGTSQKLLVGASEEDIESWITHELDQQSNNVTSSEHTSHSVTCQDRNNFNVCYGMVHRASARLMGNMPELLASLKDQDIPQIRSHLLLDVVPFEEQLCISLPSGKLVAQLNKPLQDALHSLVKAGHCYVKALVHTKTVFDDIGSATKLKEAQTKINLNLYGLHESSSDDGQKVGRQLSTHKVWLQRPDWHMPGTVYDNPHFLRIHGKTNDHTPQSSEDTNLGAKSANLQDSINEVYSLLTRDMHVQRMAGDKRLQNSLLPHQEQALNFMVQRETGPIPEEFSLWEPRTSDGQTWYHHKLIGVRSKTLPLETGGGILADEMGMGKTFSTLSLIVRSLQDAEAWSSDPTTFLADEISPSLQLSRATLVVVPSPLLLKTWTREIEGKLNITLQTMVHHGEKKSTNVQDLANHDIVITTYHTLIADYNKGQSQIANIAWYRIVLDEAHFIRKTSTLLYKRSAELKAKFRWCLTGTPIQNRLDDIGALFSFLKIFPFDRMGVFRACVTVPFSEGPARRARAIQNLAKLLDSLCIRRTKDLLTLSNFKQTIHEVSLSYDENLQYQKSKDDMKRAIHNVVGNSASRSRFGMFQAQLQLRLLCNHGTFQHQFHWNRTQSLLDMNATDMREDAFALAGGTGETLCSGCQQPICPTDIDPARASNYLCRHTLCSECRQNTREDCPLCEAISFRQKHDERTSTGRKSALREGYFRVGGYSSKMMALIEDLEKADPYDKSIVFSQWTTTLDLIQQHLEKYRISFLRVDGTDDFRHRQNELDRFKTDENMPVLIMTTGVGAFGLDLTAANRVFLVEPQWNPSVELQAIGRTLRIGQQRVVTVTRYIVQNTVEKDIQQLQQRKLNMAGMAEKDGSKGCEPHIKSEFDPDRLDSFD